MGADRLPAVPFSIFSITAKYEFVKPPAGAVFLSIRANAVISERIRFISGKYSNYHNLVISDSIKAAALTFGIRLEVLMSTQTTRPVTDSDTAYALDLFASLSPADQAEIIALAVSALASPQ